MAKTQLNDYIANKVQYIARIEGKKYSDLSKALNLSESFIQKVHSSEKHYNSSHLFILSRYLNCNVSDFYPTDYGTFMRLYPCSSLKEEEFPMLLQQMEDEIKYRREEIL